MKSLSIVASALALAAQGAFRWMAPRPTQRYSVPRRFWSYPGKAGMSMAQQKRSAKKARNVKRHKRAVRG